MDKRKGKVFFRKNKDSVIAFKGKNKYKDLSNKIKIRKTFRLLLLTLLTLVGLALIILIGYLAYKYVFKLRNTVAKVNYEQVYGFDIPAFPNSEFIFKDSLNDDTVKTFISQGYSVYRLPRDKSISDVFDYYTQTLTSLGWQPLPFVPLTSESKLYGQYWKKDDKGLRIYSRLNDIWYESITTTQAENGLDDVVRKETQRALLLLTNEPTQLLPDFPWKLSYPSEYKANYFASVLPQYQSLSFQKLGTDNIIYIEPVGYTSGNTYDGYIDKEVSNLNKTRKEKWKVINSIETEIKGETVVKAEITDGKRNGSSTAIRNSQNDLIYVITTLDAKDPFYDFILSRLKVNSLNP